MNPLFWTKFPLPEDISRNHLGGSITYLQDKGVYLYIGAPPVTPLKETKKATFSFKKGTS